MIKNKLSTVVVAALCAATFNSCVPSLKMRKQELKVPDHFENHQMDSLNKTSLVRNQFFKDQHLISLIDRALEHNQELQMVLQQVAIAKNKVQFKKGEYLPFIYLNATAEREKVGEFTRNGAVERNIEIEQGALFPEPLNNFSLAASAFWELDIWKKLRNEKKAAVMEYLASQEGRNFSKTQLVAEVSSLYYELIALDNQLMLIDQNLKIQENALNMVKLQKSAARVSELAVKRFEAELYKNISHRLEIVQQSINVENELNFLLGRTPQSIERNSTHFVNQTIERLAVGVPGQLIQNRPDVRRAELELQAAKLDLKAARANFYPSLGLKARIGVESYDKAKLSHIPESLLHAVIGDLVTPLINRNAIKAMYKSANSKQLMALVEYEKTLLEAVIEVQTQNSKIENLNSEVELRIKQVEAMNQSITLSTNLFQSARIEYLEVLLAQREALEAQLELVETKKNQLISNVQLYRFLGGGWQ